MFTIAARPTGLAVVTHLDPASRVLRDGLDAIIAEYADLDFDYLATEKSARLNVVANDWESIRERLDKMRRQARA